MMIILQWKDEFTSLLRSLSIFHSTCIFTIFNSSFLYRVGTAKVLWKCVFRQSHSHFQGAAEASLLPKGRFAGSKDDQSTGCTPPWGLTRVWRAWCWSAENRVSQQTQARQREKPGLESIKGTWTIRSSRRQDGKQGYYRHPRSIPQAGLESGLNTSTPLVSLGSAIMGSWAHGWGGGLARTVIPGDALRTLKDWSTTVTYFIYLFIYVSICTALIFRTARSIYISHFTVFYSHCSETVSVCIPVFKISCSLY